MCSTIVGLRSRDRLPVWHKPAGRASAGWSVSRVERAVVGNSCTSGWVSAVGVYGTQQRVCYHPLCSQSSRVTSDSCAGSHRGPAEAGDTDRRPSAEAPQRHASARIAPRGVPQCGGGGGTWSPTSHVHGQREIARACRHPGGTSVRQSQAATPNARARATRSQPHPPARRPRCAHCPSPAPHLPSYQHQQ
jgi:hypothetical protein